MPLRIKTYLPLAALAGSVACLGLVGLAIEPGSAVLVGMGCALIAARR